MDGNINSFLTKQISLGREIKYARMINKEDYKIDWGNNAIEISRKIKGLYPRANTTFRGKNLKIIKIRISKSSEFADVGSAVEVGLDLRGMDCINLEL